MKSLHLFTRALIALVLLFGVTTIATAVYSANSRRNCETRPAVSPNIRATFPVPSPRANV
jgi:hypothetical protein